MGVLSMREVVRVGVRVLWRARRVEQTGDVELCRRLRVGGHEDVDVVLLEERSAPRLAELRRPLLPVALARGAGHLVQLPVEDRKLMRTGAVVAVAPEP